MAQAAVQLDRAAFSCAICLDLLKDPVALSCGHNYCMRCIQTHWDGEEQQQQLYSCPQCRQRFATRPVLVKNTMLADLVEQLKKCGLQDPVDLCPVGPGDVACDVCSGEKLNAVKSCLQCLASYCETHLQPHFQSEVFRKHQLVAPFQKLQENICCDHNEVKKMFCRSDQQLICVVCCMEQHGGHHMVSVAAERAQRQTELEARRDQLLQTVQDKETDLERLHQEVLSFRRSADEAVRHSDENFTGLIRELERRRSEVEQYIRAQQETEEARVRQLQDKLQRDITELRRTQAQLEALALTLDLNQFLQDYPPLSSAEASPRIQTQPLGSFEQVTAAVSALTDLLQVTLTEGLDNISLALTQVQPEPTTREEFLKYAREITLDPNTAHTNVSLCDENKRATFVREKQNYPDHPDRFSDNYQVLSKEGLTGRCYWEVEWGGGGVVLAVAYKDSNRKEGYYNKFGNNDISWALNCESGYSFKFNNSKSEVSGSVSSRIGVYLDHDAGVLSFYSIEDQTMSLLHRVQTTFTQPLYAGVRFHNYFFYYKDTAYFPELNMNI